MSGVDAMVAETQLVVFGLDDRGYAVDLGRVERVVPRPEIAPFPRAPDIVSGVFVLHGEMIPVVNVRARFRLPEVPARLSDLLLVVRTPRRRVALIVDRVEGVKPVRAEDMVAPETIVPGLEYVRGVVHLEKGIVFVHDLDAFLSLDEEAQLDAAWEARAR